jgi:hypothetical protein
LRRLSALHQCRINFHIGIGKTAVDDLQKIPDRCSGGTGNDPDGTRQQRYRFFAG